MMTWTTLSTYDPNVEQQLNTSVVDAEGTHRALLLARVVVPTVSNQDHHDLIHS